MFWDLYQYSGCIFLFYIQNKSNERRCTLVVISHYFKNSKYPQDDRKFYPQIAHKNADWVLGTWANCFKMSARGWKRYYLISIQHHCHRMESSREQRWDSRDKYTLCCKTVCEGTYNMCHTDAQFAISELSRKFSCVIVTKSYLFDQMHSHVACHQYYAPFILFFFSEYWITYLFQGLKMCVLGMALQTEETKSTPENSRFWMYSRCWISSFT